MQTNKKKLHRQQSMPELRLVHRLSCRYRIYSPAIRDQPEKARWIETHTSGSEHIILSAKANSKTGSILVLTTHDLDPETVIATIACQLQKFIPRQNETKHKKKKIRKIFVNEQLRLLPFTNWHSTTLTKISSDLATNETLGLTPKERQTRLNHYGMNSYQISAKIEHSKLIKDQLFNFPTGMLLGSTILSIITGRLIDAGLIMTVVFLNGSIGFKTSLSAERAISSLGELVREPVQVLINGLWQKIQPKDLVPGDIIKLEGGIVPADCIVIHSDGLTTDESGLTGESHNRYKYSDTLPEDTAVADRHNMLFAGTISTGGQGIAVVVETGPSTEMGKITALTAKIDTRKSLLQNQLDRLGAETVTLASTLCLGFFVAGMIRGTSFLEMLRTSISLAVAAIPEGLTAVGTISFAFGIRRMQKKQIYARDLRSIENLGNVHYFCLDKTGTVTANKMTVSHIWTDGKIYAPNEHNIIPHLKEIIKVAVLCNDAKLDQVMEQGPIGSPTEVALLELASSLGFDIEAMRTAHPRSSTTYRSIDRRYMTTSHAVKQNNFTAIKGDPSKVLKKCATILAKGKEIPLTDSHRKTIKEANRDMGLKGLRVLGFGRKTLIDNDDQDQQRFCWLGLVAINDPPREGVKELIDSLHRAGIKTMLITGDQLPTAISVAKQLGFNGKSAMNALDAKTLHALNPANRHDIVAGTQVFARVSPEEKLIIVKTLQEKGFVVAMTGDGVNDSPALRAADIGVAMGKSGSITARETADVVIGDDRLQTMIEAIIEGRSIRKNMKQATNFLLATNYAEMASMIIGLLLKGRSFLSPVQLLWINMITDVFPALAMAARPANKTLGDESPLMVGSALFSQQESSKMMRDAIVMAVSTIPHFMGKYGDATCNGKHHESQISEFLTTLVTSQMTYAFSLNGNQHPTSKDEANHRLLLYSTFAGTLLLQIILPSVPLVAKFLGLNTMSLKRAAASMSLGIAPVILSAGLNQLFEQRGSTLRSTEKG